MANPTSVNEYGTVVSVHRCTACGREFTVCPAVPVEKEDQWQDCLADECPSYDIGRDAMLFFEPLADAGLIERQAVRPTPLGGESRG